MGKGSRLTHHYFSHHQYIKLVKSIFICSRIRIRA